MKNLYVVRDIPNWGEHSSYTYIVSAEDPTKAVDIVTNITGIYGWTVDVPDSSEILK